MFDLGWSELLIIGVVALIVVGPKDLPILFRKVGQFVGKAKGMAREFSNAMNDAADDTGMREISSGLNKSLKAATNPLGTAMDGVKSATKSLADINPDSETGKLAAERAENAAKMKAVRDRNIAERKEREAAEAVKAADTGTAKPDASATEKAPAKKPAEPKPAVAKKAPAKKAPAKTPAAAKSAAAKKPAVKKPAAKKPAAKKSDT
ncbi:Sec-independent protein translocase protein TatB [Roseobacter sp. GAI101]|uniref:Sec-independent protein translocase protein TatB n=1 Tax=Roseobacter sp. (strain GAI101) TaxID=391589 RepID=UPI0001871836|nr:Sec-independent protein translocase protein TatB [Roseobacter sp. GAI101]EEB83767.1 twin-arginine translocation protein TatB [Roseobacter sp. GAI101]